MNNIKIIYVEKRLEYRDEANITLTNINKDLHLNISELRIINRYDISNINDNILDLGIETILKEPMVDDAYLETIDTNGYKMFAIEFLPGQYDQRSDSCKQCFMILEPSLNIDVKYAKVFLIKDISDNDLVKVQNYLINPVERRLAKLDKPDTLVDKIEQVNLIDTINDFIKYNDNELNEYLVNNRMAMSYDDIKVIQDYFNKEKRDPTETELKVLDTYWSDHCRHTTFSTILKDISVDDGPFSDVLKASLNEYELSRHAVYGLNTTRPMTLMDLATIGVKELRKNGALENLEVSEEINACSIEIDVNTDKGIDKYLLMFKNETHNHPTEIEPFGGAATCLGGCIRDPLSGRSYVYQSMRITGASNPLEKLEDTMDGKLPQSKICQDAAHGFSSYGNQIGLATGYVKEIYHPGYKAKRMELGAVIAACPKDQVKRLTPSPNDIILLIGGRTGRDGIGGATGSSKSHDITSLETTGAEVQKGNPIEERKIQRLFRDEEVSSKIIRCNDFGAGGVCVAVGELCDGLIITLDNVLRKYEGLNGTELAISESQERMAIVIDPKDEQFIKDKCYKENLEVVQVATVTKNPRLVMKFLGQTIVDISREFLDQAGAKRYQDIKISLPKTFEVTKGTKYNNFNELITDTLSSLNCCSQKGLVEMFDSSIGNNTVISPFGGKYLNTESQAMCALIPTLGKETTTCSLMAHGYDPYISEISPYHGATYAIVESISKIVSMGANYKDIYFTFQEYFEKLLNDPYKWGTTMAALLGANKLLKDLKLGAIGGKDSMSGTFMNLHVPPTFVSFAVTSTDVSRIITPEIKNKDHILVELIIDKDQYNLFNTKSLESLYNTIYNINKDIYSAYTITSGGIIEAISKMSFGNKIGININNDLSLDYLVEKNYGNIILELDNNYDLSIFNNYKIIGYTNDTQTITYNNVSINIDTLYDIHSNTLEPIYKTKTINNKKTILKSDYDKKTYPKAKTKVTNVNVCIPVFPGTNCEYDSKRSFEKAGATVNVVVIKNKTEQMIKESIKELKDAINNCNILMLAGGFSAGDEPEGSGKYIATFLRNKELKNAIEDLLDNRDGLMIGICNGFQALIKLGLLPYGKISKMKDNDPTLTFNQIARHQAKMVNTRIGSVNSPWLKYVNVNDNFITPISHGEGRFVCDDNMAKELFENGQVFSQYVDYNNNINPDVLYNPNGSYHNIEGIISKDGRILGKMAHSERIGNNRLKNIYGQMDQKLFEAAVDYYKDVN